MKRVFSITVLLLAMATVGKAQNLSQLMFDKMKCKAETCIDDFATAQGFTFSEVQDPGSSNGEKIRVYKKAVTNAAPNYLAVYMVLGTYVTQIEFSTASKADADALVEKFKSDLSFVYDSTDNSDDMDIATYNHTGAPKMAYKVISYHMPDSFGGKSFTSYHVVIMTT